MPKLEMETFYDFYKNESIDKIFRVILGLWTETVDAPGRKDGKRESCVSMWPWNDAVFRRGVEYLGVAEVKKIEVI